jgi:hypothetical protein
MFFKRMKINICFISRTSALNKTLTSTLGKTSNSPSTTFPKDRQQTPLLTLGIVGVNSHVEHTRTTFTHLAYQEGCNSILC